MRPKRQNEVKFLAVEIDAGLFREFKIMAAEQDRTMTSLVEEAMNGYLKKVKNEEDAQARIKRTGRLRQNTGGNQMRGGKI